MGIVKLFELNEFVRRYPAENFDLFMFLSTGIPIIKFPLISIFDRKEIPKMVDD